MTSTVRATLLAALAMAAASCGGGSSSPPAVPPPPPPPPAGPNVAPAWTSPPAVTVQENASGVAYLATATDPDTATLTYTLGGTDAALFNINALTHEIRFNTAPDFEAPTDNGANNVYNLTLQVSDGIAAPVAQTVAITVSNVNAGFRVRRVASGLNQPIFVAGLPDNTGRIIVVQRGGTIRVLNGSTGAASPDFLSIANVDTSGEKGLLTIAFSNNYLSDRTFYVHMNPNTANTSEIRQYRAPAAPDVADPASANPILVLNQSSATNHKGGFFAVDPQNRLLIGFGDGGNTPETAQDPNDLRGKILRIDPTLDSFPTDANRDYSIPAGNPFASGGGAPEVLAMGMRNPFRGSIDPISNSILIGDVGQSTVEEVDRIALNHAGAPVPNFGWVCREGTLPFNGCANSPAFTNPVAQYDRNAGPAGGTTVTGGVVYRGPIEDLQGQYIFADFGSNNLWTIPVANLVTASGNGTTILGADFTNRNTAFTPDTGAGSMASVVAVGTDQDGNIYFVDIGGEVFRLEPLP
jgi:glucose/arabinose dehydrogenase